MRSCVKMQTTDIEATVLDAASTVEQKLDNEIDRLDALNYDDLEELRRKRIEEMKKKAESELLWRRSDHGKLCRIVEKDFFSRPKESERCVFVLSRPGTSTLARDFEEYLARVAERHLETFFGLLDAEKCPFICDRFHLQIMPSVIIVKDQKVCRVLHGLDYFSTNGKFSARFLESRLYELGMLTNMDINDGL